MVPIQKVLKRYALGEMLAGFFRVAILYKAKDNAAAKIHQSPCVNLKCNSTSQLPRLSNNKMPLMQMSKPSMRQAGILSFKKIRASINENTGDEVVPINARLMAEEK